MSIDSKKILSTKLPKSRPVPFENGRFDGTVSGLALREVPRKDGNGVSVLLDIAVVFDPTQVAEMSKANGDAVYDSGAKVSKFVNLDNGELTFSQGQNREIWEIVKGLNEDATSLDEIIGASCQVDVVKKFSAKGNAFNEFEFVLG